MNRALLSRWTASLTLAPLAVLTLQGLALNAYALTDTNAELKGVAADRSARVVVVAQATRPVAARTVWVPTSPKRLDGFKPVLPPERALGLAMAQAHAQSGAQARSPQVLAKADVAHAAAGR